MLRKCPSDSAEASYTHFNGEDDNYPSQTQNRRNRANTKRERYIDVCDKKQAYAQVAIWYRL